MDVRERNGEPAPEVKPEPGPVAKAAKPAPIEREPVRVTTTAATDKPGKKVATELAKLVSLRDQGILTEDEFQAARRRLVGTA